MNFLTAKTHQAEADSPPIGEIIQVGLARVHYFEKGSGPVVLLIHGASGNLRDFDFGLMDKIAKTHRVIAIDRPGHGYSTRLNLYGESPNQQAQVFVDTLRQLGVDQGIVVGYSLGGIVALAMALDFPEFTKALLLISAVSHPPQGRAGWLYTLAGSHFTGPFVARAIAAIMPKDLVADKIKSVFHPQHPPANYEDKIGTGLALRANSIRANARQVVTLLPHIKSMVPRYKDLTLPVEILHGDRDTSVPADQHSGRLAAAVPGARYSRLHGIGHAPHHAAQKEILQALARLQKQLDAV